MAGKNPKREAVLWLLDKAWQVVKKGTTKAVEVAPAVVQPAKDFTRGFVRNAPRYNTVNKALGVTETTVTASLRAGMQARYLAVGTAKVGAVRGPALAYRVIKYGGKIAVRDTATYAYSYAVYPYQIARAARNAAGKATALERSLDKAVFNFGARLRGYGLEPRIRGFIATSIRYALIYDAVKVSKFVQEKADAVQSYAKDVANRYSHLSSGFDFLRGTNGNVATGTSVPSAGPAVVGTPNPVVPLAPNPSPVAATQRRTAVGYGNVGRK